MSLGDTFTISVGMMATLLLATGIVGAIVGYIFGRDEDPNDQS